MKVSIYCAPLLLSILLIVEVESRGGGRGGGGRSSSGGGRSFGGWGSSSRGSSSRGSSSGWFRSSSSSRVTSVSRSSYPKQQWGTVSSSSVGRSSTGRLFSSPSTSSRRGHVSTSGYGTNYGTSYDKKVRQSYMASPGYSKRMMGLGVGAGFIAGAAVGGAATAASHGVYHRYQAYKHMLRSHYHYQHDRRPYDYNSWEDDDDYYPGGTYRSGCYGDCPANSHCVIDYCECDNGYTKQYGSCTQVTYEVPLQSRENPFRTCRNNSECLAIDINMVCLQTNNSTSAGMKCGCRKNMKWNTEKLECQIFIDVDCTRFKYDDTPAAVITKAVDVAKANYTEVAISENSTVLNQNETLKTSLLPKINVKAASKTDLDEAFCRDVDSFLFQLDTVDSRPEKCIPVPKDACAIVFDSHDCSGGWSLVVKVGSIRFPYFSYYWKYRNDIDTIGVRVGCTLFVYSGDEYNRNTGVLKADISDGWWVLGEIEELKHLENDIESMACECKTNA